jgi:hypothetical protein
MQKELTEKEAEDFLEKEKFEVIERATVKTKEELKNLNIDFPWAMKISSKKIVHKAKLGGVILNINNLEEAKKAFEKLSEIEAFSEVIVQKMFQGEELILGVKKTPEFGQVIMFGKGGGKVEEEKDITFRVLPITKKEAGELIKDVKFYKTVEQKKLKKELIIKNLIKLSNLAKKYSNLLEIDINPFMINQKESRVIDARIIFEE